MTSSILLLAGAALASLRAKSDSANRGASVDLVAVGGGLGFSKYRARLEPAPADEGRKGKKKARQGADLGSE